MNLFEFSNKESYKGDLNELESFLDEVWSNRDNKKPNEKESLGQRFLDVNHKKKLVKAQNYVGVVHFGDNTLNLLPKIFYKEGIEKDSNHLQNIQQHLFWWLGYCKRIKFPKYLTSSSSMNHDFFEVLIYHFAIYTRTLLNSSFYQQYQELSEETTFLKGRINTSKYITENISRGNWHKFNCTYDSFVVDNQFNRVIKYVSSLLYGETKVQENKNLLYEILFMLDDVTDMTMTSEDCRHIKFNAMMEEFEVVRDYCLLFLENSTIYTYKDNLRLFAFLLPMEYIFEDFVYGFIKQELPEIEVDAQSQKVKLDLDESYTLKPDLLFRLDNKLLIGDTKYKLIDDDKRPVKQSDLYQMVSYAIRYKCNEVILFYPNTIVSREVKNYSVQIENLIPHKDNGNIVSDVIEIKAHILPFIKEDQISFIDHIEHLRKCFKGVLKL